LPFECNLQRYTAAFSKKHKRLDILVNNAGLNTTGSYKGPTTTAQDYEICMGTNYFGRAGTPGCWIGYVSSTISTACV
jgi:NAD(P)-dependent dehydrogenase (short-subunit alcohol dehydrogenase family)